MTLTPNLIACLAIGGAGILTALLSIPFSSTLACSGENVLPAPPAP